MPNQVESKTRELCQAILDHLQAGGARKRIDAFLADEPARSHYERVMSQGQALHEQQHRGQTPAATEIASFEKERDALLKNPLATAFLDAQQELHDLQHLVQKYVRKAIELNRVPTEDDMNCDSCENHGGCGCDEHHHH